MTTSILISVLLLIAQISAVILCDKSWFVMTIIVVTTIGYTICAAYADFKEKQLIERVKELEKKAGIES